MEPEPQAEANIKPRYMSSMLEEDKKGENTQQPRSSANDYLDSIMEQPSTGGGVRPRWQTHSFGDDLRISIRKPLSQEQLEQLQLAANLLRSIIKG